MSNETTSPVAKRILIGVCVVSFCVVGVLFLIGTYPARELRAAKELETRGFEIGYARQENSIWQYPYSVFGKNLSITADDSRLVCQLAHLQNMRFWMCDLSGLNLDDIWNCRELRYFFCTDARQFPVDEIRKLAACPIFSFSIPHARLNDSDLAEFTKWTKLESLCLNDIVGITDAGLEHLEKIASLRELYLIETSVTQEGIEEFQRKRPDVVVSLFSMMGGEDSNDF